jgi:TIGR00701 family protein
MNLYLLFKSLHLVAVISWMAGLLYLPRIFVYHVENFEKKETKKVFEIMEKRLFNYIMRPAMLLSWFLGIILILIIGIETFSFLWLQIKLILVLLLSVYNEYLGKYIKLLQSGENKKSARFFRIINEIPTVLLIFVVFIVIFKPL